MTKSLDQIHREKLGKQSDKWASYFPYYERRLKETRDAPITLLEIGVQNGGSLETWAAYFPNAIHIIGCDINQKCSRLEYEDQRIKVVIGNANNPATFEAIRGLSESFDIVIDDGSHTSFDIINSFLLYFALLKPGGLYIIEDAHTLYSHAYGGGITNEAGAYGFFKKLIDVLSYQFWRNELSLGSHLATFFPDRRLPKFIADGWVEEIEFRNSLIGIRKATVPGHEKLGERLICGPVALVTG